MALPAGYEEQEGWTREDWLKRAQEKDPTKRKIVGNCIRDLGRPPSEYMSWTNEERVDFIMEHVEEKPAGKKASKKAAVSEEEAPTTTKSSGGGGGIDAATKAAITKNNELLRKIHDLLVVLIYSNPKAQANAEDMEVEVQLLGNE